MAVSTRTQTEIGEGVDIGLLIIGALTLLILTRGSGSTPLPSPGSGGPGASAATIANIGVLFSSGPSTVSASTGQSTALTPLVTRLTNNAQVDATVAVSVPIVPQSGTTYTGGKWYTTYGLAAGAHGVASVQVKVPAGGYTDVTWNTGWTGNHGTYQSQAVVTVAGQAQTFPGPTFTVQVLTAASLSMTVRGGWSGTVQVQQGQAVRPPELYTDLTNNGETQGVWAVQVPIRGTVSGLRWFVDTRQSLPAGVQVSDVAGVGISNSGCIVTLAPGASVTIPWTTTWSGNAGSYQDIGSATPQ